MTKEQAREFATRIRLGEPVIERSFLIRGSSRGSFWDSAGMAYQAILGDTVICYWASADVAKLRTWCIWEGGPLSRGRGWVKQCAYTIDESEIPHVLKALDRVANAP
jgi:hypothetical protein